MHLQSETTAGTRYRWTPGEPWRPLTFYQAGLLRGHADPANTSMRHALEQHEAQAEADGLACPRCDAPVGERCFGPDARSNHPMRAIAYWAARVQARNCHLCGGLGYSEGYACSCPLGAAA